MIVTLFAVCNAPIHAQVGRGSPDDELPLLDLPKVNGGSDTDNAGPDFSPDDLDVAPPLRDVEPLPNRQTPDFDADNGDAADDGNAPDLEDILDATRSDASYEQRIYDYLAPVFSSGDWYNCCCWYTQVHAVALWRSVGKGTTLARDQSIIPPRQITTDNTGFRVEPGLRLRLGSFFGRDYANRDASVEAEYLGLFDWQTGTRLASFAPQQIFTALDPTGGAIGAFNRADFQRLVYSGDFNSFEINVRMANRPGRDRMVAMPDGTWSRQMAEGGVSSYLAGLRYIGIDERLRLTSGRVGVSPVLFSGDYDVKTHNALVGLQFGGEYKYLTKNWSAGFESKVGAFLNIGDVQRQIRSINTAPLPGEILINFAGVQRANVLAVALDMRIFARYHITPNFIVRGGWDAIWVNGLGLATEQLTFEPSRARFNLGGNTFYQGLSLGLEKVW